MGLIKKRHREEKDTISLRLEVGVIAMLSEYAEYLDDSKDYIVTEALRYAFRSDKEFQAHLTAKHIGDPLGEIDELYKKTANIKRPKKQSPAEQTLIATQGITPAK